MLTKRKKQNLLFLGLGIIIGTLFSGSIAYFSVIKQYTKTKIDKIQLAFPATEEDTIITKSILPKTIKITQPSTNNDSVNQQNEILPSDSLELDTNIISNFEIIKTDTKIESMTISIVNLDLDSMATSNDCSTEILVEQWENPTNFSGYRKNKTTLIIYGISIDEIELHFSNNTLFLIYRDKKLTLKESNSFIRFPSTFIAR